MPQPNRYTPELEAPPEHDLKRSAQQIFDAMQLLIVAVTNMNTYFYAASRKQHTAARVAIASARMNYNRALASLADARF